MKKILNFAFLIYTFISFSLLASQSPKDAYLDLSNLSINSTCSPNQLPEIFNQLDTDIPLKYDQQKNLYYRVFDTKEQAQYYSQNYHLPDDQHEKLLGPSNNRDRRRILGKDVRLNPWNCQFYLELVYDNVEGECKIYYGSATLIQPNILLTAAHNLYDQKDGGYPDQINCFGACYINDVVAEGTVFPKKHSTSVFVSSQYTDPKSSYQTKKSYDIGLIIFETETAKTFASKITTQVSLVKNFSNLTLNQLKELTFNVTGYPGEREAYTMEGKATLGTLPNTIHYDIDTTKGQSGSGIWFKNSGKIYCVGTHVSRGGQHKNYNIGVLINPEIKSVIEAHPFSIGLQK